MAVARPRRMPLWASQLTTGSKEMAPRQQQVEGEPGQQGPAPGDDLEGDDSGEDDEQGAPQGAAVELDQRPDTRFVQWLDGRLRGRHFRRLAGLLVHPYPAFRAPLPAGVLREERM
jgi:hypothetical protein